METQPTSLNPKTASNAAPPTRTLRERIGGATLEFLDAKSRGSAATLVGEGFRKLSDRWGLGAADWETSGGSIARALVDDAIATQLAPVVSDLLVDGYLARLREVGEHARELNAAMVHLVDWIDRFTPFRFVLAWAQRGGPSDAFWTVAVESIAESGTSHRDAATGQDRSPSGVASVSSSDPAEDLARVVVGVEALRRASHELTGQALSNDAGARGVVRICDFASHDVILTLASRLDSASWGVLLAESARFTEPSTLARALMSSDVRWLAAAVYAIETFPTISEAVAREVLHGIPIPADDHVKTSVLQALSVARGGILARFVRVFESNGMAAEWAPSFAGCWQHGRSRLTERLSMGEVRGKAHPTLDDAAVSSWVEWVVAAAITRNAPVLDEVWASLTDFAPAHVDSDRLVRRAVRLALVLREPEAAKSISRRVRLSADASHGAALLRETTPDPLFNEEFRRSAAHVDDRPPEPRLDAVKPPLPAPGTDSRVGSATVEGRCFSAGRVRSRAVDIVLLVTGVEVLRFLTFSLLWLLGFRRDGTLSIRSEEIRVSTRVSFLGREVRAKEIRVLNPVVRAVTTAKAWRTLYLFAGLVAIAGLTLLGVSAIFDGVARQHAGIITFGALLVAAGLMIDGACYWLFLRGGERVYVKVTLSAPEPPLRLWVARESSDAVVAAVSALTARRANAADGRFSVDG